MDWLREIWAWSLANYQGVLVDLGLLVASLEMILSRFSPSKKRRSITMKIVQYIHKALDVLKVPDVKRDEQTKKIMLYGHVGEKHE